MNKQVVLGIVRHILTGVGGYFVGTGLIDAAGAETAIGAIIALAGIIWSAIDKKDAA